jgi:hypothetical protein
MSIVSNKIPIFCPMCDIMMGTGQDTEFFLTYGVCKDCSIMFAEPRKKKWKEGWRPSEKEIKEFKSTNSKRVFSILSQIDNYI